VNKWKKRWWSLALVMVGMVLAFMLYNQFLNREPSYEGKRLRVWFQQYCRAGSNDQYNQTQLEEATFALRHMGTNALPYLLEHALNTNRDSAFKTNLSAVLRALPSAWGFRPFITDEEMRVGAGSAIHDLKPPGHALLPALTNLLTRPNDPNYFSALYLSGCAGSGGEAAVPYLVQGLQQQGGWASAAAAQSLEWLGPQAKAAVPAVITALGDPDGSYRFMLMRALGGIGSDAHSAIPALEPFLTRTNDRLYAAIALCQIEPGHTGAVAILRGEIQSTNSQARQPALVAMQKLQRGDIALAPELITTAWNAEDPAAPYALIALQKLSPKLAQPLIRRQLPMFPLNLQLLTAESILRLDADQPEALATLLQGLSDKTWRGAFIDRLGSSGPNTRETKEALQKVAKEDPTRAIRIAAQEAIKRIERRARNAPAAAQP
jgi:hypothetical protein